MTGGAAASIAEFATLPIDTAKVRLQLARSAGAGSVTESMIGTMRTIVADEGVRGLFKGLAPAIHRQLVFATLRIGLYAEITEKLKAPGESTLSLGRKIVAGLLSGAIGITIANVRLARQRESGRSKSNANPPTHPPFPPCSPLTWSRFACRAKGA